VGSRRRSFVRAGVNADNSTNLPAFVEANHEQHFRREQSSNVGGPSRRPSSNTINIFAP
ncbi:unnamed protein product, partial [Amoebophrya sp. A25]